MNHQQITAERGRRAADLRAAAVALLEQQSIAAGVMLDLDSDQVVAAGPKAAILYLLSNGAPAATSGDAPTDVQVAAARAVLEQKWDAEGACESCGWHAALGEYHVDADDISDALQHGGRLILQCISKDDETRDSHRGVSIDLIARIECGAAPAPAEYRKLTGDLTLKELAAEFCAVADLGGDVTLSAGACRKLFEAMTTPPAAAPATASGDELPRADLSSHRSADTYAQRLYGPDPTEDQFRDALCTMALIVAASETDSAVQANLTAMWFDVQEHIKRQAAAALESAASEVESYAASSLWRKDIFDTIASRIRALKDSDRAAVSAATKPTAERVHIEGLRKELAHQRRVAQEWFDRYMSAITPVPLDLSTLPRYDHRGALMAPDETGDYLLFNDVRPLLATKPAAAPVDRASVLREVEAVIEQAISDMLTKKGQVAGATFCLDAIRAMLAAAPVRLPQRFTAGLPAEGQKTLEDAARKLVTYSHIYTGDKQARRLAVELSLMAEMMSRTPAASTTGAAQTAEQVRERQREECWSRDEEDFNHLSLSDLIDSHEDLKPGDTVWVGEAVHPEAAQMVNVDSILENIGEAAYDIGGEHAEDYPDVTAEQTKELEQLVVDWLNRSCNTSFWTVTNIKPYVLSADDFPTPTHSSEAGDA